MLPNVYGPCTRIGHRGKEKLMRTKLLGLGLAATMVAGLFGLAGPATAAANAKVNVVHGIPGLTVDVCVDGAKAIPDFQPGDAVKGVALPAGSHTFKIVAQGDACSASAILSVSPTLEAGKNYTAIANLDDTGAPNIKLFTNNVNPTKPGNARLTVRHTADAPAVNVWANGGKLIGGKDFTWGRSASLQTPRGIYSAWVSLPGDFEPVIGPAVLQLKAGVAYQVYAWGDGTNGYHLAVVNLNVGTN
jgi:hypothetical protein